MPAFKTTWFWQRLVSLTLLLAIFSSQWSLPVLANNKIPSAPLPGLGRNYDVIVVGSDPEGIAAAISAARNSLNTLLVDYRTKVGGLYTLGWLNTLDINYYKTGKHLKIINKGIFEEFYRAVGSRDAFDISLAQQVFETMLTTTKVNLLLGIKDQILPLMDGSKIKGVEVTRDGQKLRLYAKTVIDATQDADLAAAAGVPYKMGRADLGLTGEIGATTLVFAVEDVDWEIVKKDLTTDDNPFTGATDFSAWGYEKMFKAPTKDPNVQMRGLNAGRQQNGTVVINALQVFHVNPLDIKSRQMAMKQAQAELPGIIAYMRRNLPGWEKAKLVGSAPELYIRESRHIKGIKTLTSEDIFQSRFPEDRIALGSYPIDIQARKKGMTGSILSGSSPYGIPLGVMVPVNIDGLLVVGRSASFDTIAHGSARTVPVGIALGQAAGVAARVARKNEITFRQMAVFLPAIRQTQSLLKSQGVDLTPVKVEQPEQKSWAYPYIIKLRSQGLLSRGYQNDYKLYFITTSNSLRKMFHLINYNSNLNFPMEVLESYDLKEFISGTTYLRIISDTLKHEIKTYQELQDLGLIDRWTLLHLDQENEFLTNEQIYALGAGLVDYLKQTQTFSPQKAVE